MPRGSRGRGELGPHGQAVGAGALAGRGAAGAADRLAAGRELGVMVRGHPLHAVVLVVHRIAEDVVDGDVGRAGGQALRAAHPAVPRRGLLAVAGDHLEGGPVQGLGRGGDVFLDVGIAAHGRDARVEIGVAHDPADGGLGIAHLRPDQSLQVPMLVAGEDLHGHGPDALGSEGLDQGLDLLALHVVVDDQDDLGEVRLQGLLEGDLGVMRGKAREPHLAGLLELVVGAQDLLVLEERRQVLDAVDHGHVDVIGLEPLEAVLHPLDDRGLIDLLAEVHHVLGGDDDLVADALAAPARRRSRPSGGDRLPRCRSRSRRGHRHSGGRWARTGRWRRS